MNITTCTVEGCTAKRAGLAMCARHLFAWAFSSHVDEHAA